ncbi:MAG: UDP-N-acetylmuramate--L-alanine ligase [Corynebacterium sp.]|nr:UDP-N-acetylmuramate--L-alanine ligase [Corynebacterium sp.]
MATHQLDEVNLDTVDLSHVHFIGIGGAGMSGLARIVLSRGYAVSGSDANDSRVLFALKSMGAEVFVGHEASQIAGATVVVISYAAIPDDNPELVAAKEAGIPIICRSDLLALLMRDSEEFLIAGTHGKTSTTSMAVTALQEAGVDPSFAIGGQLNKSGTNAHQGTEAYFVAEADESDASLLKYRPKVAVVTNIEPDHLDYFGDAESYHTVFRDFVKNILPGGSLIVCLEDEHARALGLYAQEYAASLPEASRFSVYGYGDSTYGTDIPLLVELYSVEGQEGTVVIQLADREVQATIEFRAVGRHMILNACGAVAGAIRLLADRADSTLVKKLLRGVAGFTGVRRRFELKGEILTGPYAGVEVYDDYAHHPTEVDAVVRAARTKTQGRVVVVFQPHLYSRTMEFAAEFATALALADQVVVLDIYGAREKPVEGVDGRIISDKIPGAVFEPNFSQVPARMRDIARPDDLIITMGAGSVTMLSEEILRELSS